MIQPTPIAAIALLLAACQGSNDDGAPAEPVTDANSPTMTPAAVDRDVAPSTTPSSAALGGAGQGKLTGRVSSLAGRVEGVNSRVTEFGTVIELPSDALFAFDSAELGPDSETLLRKALAVIRQAPPGPLGMIGHTDSKGGDAYNDRLSNDRAQAVADWMAMQPGIRQREMKVEGRGEREPVAPNTTPSGTDDPAGRARNRRVELVLPNPA